MDTDLTLRGLEGVVRQLPNENISTLVKRCIELREKKLVDFDIEDLRLMIGQKEGLQYLIPLALNALIENPFAEGDYYEGDLLESLLKAPYAFWQDHQELIFKMNLVVSKAKAMIDEVDIIDKIKQQIIDLIQSYEENIGDVYK